MPGARMPRQSGVRYATRPPHFEQINPRRRMISGKKTSSSTPSASNRSARSGDDGPHPRRDRATGARRGDQLRPGRKRRRRRALSRFRPQGSDGRLAMAFWTAAKGKPSASKYLNYQGKKRLGRLGRLFDPTLCLYPSSSDHRTAAIIGWRS